MLLFSPGDVLLYQAPAIKLSNTFPELIRLITGNKVIHVALYLGYNNGHVILEALSDGVNIKTLGNTEIYDRVNGFKLYGISRLPNISISSNNIVFMVAAAKYNKSPYGYLTILNLLFQHMKTRIFPKLPWTVWFKSKHGYICSEVSRLVLQDVLEINNIKLPFLKPAAVTEPDDYLAAPWKVILNK